MNEAFTLLAMVGATLIVVRGVIFSRLRSWWPTFFGCSQCVGFWFGGAGGVLALSVTLKRGWWLDGLVTACVVSLVSMATDIVLLKLADGPLEDEKRR